MKNDYHRTEPYLHRISGIEGPERASAVMPLDAGQHERNGFSGGGMDASLRQKKRTGCAARVRYSPSKICSLREGSRSLTFEKIFQIPAKVDNW